MGEPCGVHVQTMQKMSEWREGVYVRVYGALSEFEGNFRILAFNVRKVTDFNEVSFLSASKSWRSACTAFLHAIHAQALSRPDSYWDHMPHRSHITTCKQSFSTHTCQRVAQAPACSQMG